MSSSSPQKMTDIKGFVDSFFTSVDEILQTAIHDGYNGIMHYVDAPLKITIVICIAILGWKTWFSVGEGIKVSEFLKFILTVALVYMFAMNWANFSFYLVGLLQRGLADGVSAAVIGGDPHQTLNQSIQQGINTINSAAHNLLNKAGISALSYFLYSAVVYALGFVMMALIILELITAKVMFAVLLTLAPIVIPTTLFKRTETIFNNWLGNLVGFVFLYIMIAVLIKFAIVLVTNCLPVAGKTITDDYFIAIGSRIGIFIMISIIICLLISKVSATAMHIGGGVASSGAGAFVGGMLMSMNIAKMAAKGGLNLAKGGLLTGAYGAVAGTKVAKAAMGQLKKLRTGG